MRKYTEDEKFMKEAIRQKQSEMFPSAVLLSMMER